MLTPDQLIEVMIYDIHTDTMRIGYEVRGRAMSTGVMLEQHRPFNNEQYDELLAKALVMLNNRVRDI